MYPNNTANYKIPKISIPAKIKPHLARVVPAKAGIQNIEVHFLTGPTNRKPLNRSNSSLISFPYYPPHSLKTQ